MNNSENIRPPENSVIFRGMKEEEITAALKAMSAREKMYKKGSVIFCAGDTTEYMGMVLSGSVTIESNDMWGNRTILSHVGKGQFFAETYAWLIDEPMLVDAVANEDSRILFLCIGNVRNSAFTPAGETWPSKLIRNLLSISVRKNLTLSGRSFHTAPKSVRGRVMAYLNTVSLQKGRREFDIPFDRQQLADYLNLDRTALSKELGKMQRDGILQYKRNHFVLPDSD